ncbi:MAG: maltokinase N-terminal cap-like domain-containing protein [Acidimicrobiales bacterium]
MRSMPAGAHDPETLVIDPEAALAPALAAFLPRQRWYGAKGQALARVDIRSMEVLRAPWPALLACTVEGPSGHQWNVPVGLRPAEEAAPFLEGRPEADLGHVETLAGPARGYDALVDPELGIAILDAIAPELGAPGQVRPLGAEQSNTSLVYEERWVLKVFRRLHRGQNPEVEIPLALSRTGFERVLAPVAVWTGDDLDLGVVQPYLRAASDGWALALTSLRDLFGWLATRPPDPGSRPERRATGPERRATDPERRATGPERRATGPERRATDPERRATDPERRATDPERRAAGAARDAAGAARDAAGAGGDFADESARIGALTADLHLALARCFGTTDGDAGEWADAILGAPEMAELSPPRRGRAADRIADMRAVVSPGRSIRVHGDYHLGQVMLSDNGWTVLDFEGEPSRPLEDRRRPTSPLRDVAGMLRSLHYAAAIASSEWEDPRAVAVHARAWEARNRQALLLAYVERASGSGLLPADPASLRTILRSFELAKATYELGYERAHRPEWVAIPEQALDRLAGTGPGPEGGGTDPGGGPEGGGTDPGGGPGGGGTDPGGGPGGGGTDPGGGPGTDGRADPGPATGADPGPATGAGP